MDEVPYPKNSIGGIIFRNKVYSNKIRGGKSPNIVFTLKRKIRNKWLRKVYDAQKCGPSPGNFTELVRNGCEVIKLLLSDQEISNIPREKFRNIVKTKIASATFSCLQKMQQEHSKMKN